MVWRVLYEGSKADTQAAISLLNEQGIDHIVETLSPEEKRGTDIPLLLTPEGEFPGLKAIGFYCGYKRIN